MIQATDDVIGVSIAPAWLTYKEAQVYTGLGRTMLWKIVYDTNSGVVAAKVGTAVRINRESLDDYLRSCARS